MSATVRIRWCTSRRLIRNDSKKENDVVNPVHYVHSVMRGVELLRGGVNIEDYLADK